MRRVLGVGFVLLLALGLAPGSLFGQQSPSRDRGFQLNQNYPNPFNPETNLSFELRQQLFETGKPVKVTIRIFNVLQQLVAIPTALQHPLGNVPVEELIYETPGVKEAYWDGTDRNGRKVASGIYYMQLVVNGERPAVRKMVVAK
jgi:ABC-type dipeptide/oligopeptide/nickel transport system permease subunit